MAVNLMTGRHTASTKSGIATQERRRFRKSRLPKGTIEGTARIDRRTKDLLHRLRPGEIAVIMHSDLDPVAAEGLADRGAAAVINCHRSITGRYPTAGPLELAKARVPLIDDVGEGLLDHLADGDRIRIRGGEIFRDDVLVGAGTLLDGEFLERAIASAHEAIGNALEGFVRNTMDYLSAERDLVLKGVGIPELRTAIRGRQTVVVIRGTDHRRDLRTLRGYIKEMRPVMIAVDGAADALLGEKIRPDIIIGDMDSVSSDALACGAEIVVHAYPDGRAPGLERVQGLGIDCHLFQSAGTSEDLALLLAYDAGADLIVAVGAHDNMVEFLDKGRGGMASTFIVRLKVGPRLVDAKGVNRLYRTQVRTRDMVFLVSAAAIAMFSAAWVSPGVRLYIRGLLDWFRAVIR